MSDETRYRDSEEDELREQEQTEAQSEFGRGFLICLLKMHEHFFDDRAETIRNVHYFFNALGGDRNRLTQLDRSLVEDVEYFDRAYATRGRSIEQGLADMIWLWAQGAGDHMIEFERPIFNATTRETTVRLYDLIQESHSLMLRMRRGHPFGEGVLELYSYQNFSRLQELVYETMMEMDRILGLNPDRGQW